MKANPKVVLPLVVLAAGVLATVLLISTRQDVATQSPRIPPPVVRVHSVTLDSLQLKVMTQGTVTPRTESTLLSQVAGQVLATSPAFASGGFFETGDLLVKIDPRDYELALAEAEFRVAQARLRLAREDEEAAVALLEWERVGQGQATPLVLREPQLREAHAAVKAAAARLERTRLDLSRTRIRAPYAGRIRSKSVDIGQLVSPGTPLAKIYSVDYAEVRLPIPDQQLSFLEVSFDFRGETELNQGPDVILRGKFAGSEYTWSGRVVRIEGEIDPHTQMVYVVARVADPYGRGEDPDRPPLAVGLFVQAEVLGRSVENVVVLPRSALRGQDQVLVVDEKNRLRFREVAILRSDTDRVILHSGLTTGERVCISPLEAVVDGMRVRILGEKSETPGTKTEEDPA